MSYFDFTLRLLTAMAAGLVIGFERELLNKPAGLRTNAMVSTGSALFVLLSINIASDSSDIARIIGQIVTGVGFLGAGIIFKEGTNIHGLTTAATVWCSAAVGSIAGAGYYFEAVIGVFAILSINYFLISVENWLSKKKLKRKD
jgi:putative Mg2+ transporter-C (MgtC) family protein